MKPSRRANLSLGGSPTTSSICAKKQLAGKKPVPHVEPSKGTGSVFCRLHAILVAPRRVKFLATPQQQPAATSGGLLLLTSCTGETQSHHPRCAGEPFTPSNQPHAEIPEALLNVL